MALDLLVTTDRLSNDPIGREFVKHIQGNAAKLRVDRGALYYDYPTFADYETVNYKPDALLVSPCHGILAVRFAEPEKNAAKFESYVTELDESLAQFCSILIGRLLKSRVLRKGLSKLAFEVTPVLFSPGAQHNVLPDNSVIWTSNDGVDAGLAELATLNLTDEVISEIRSVIEGAKALGRPQKRVIEDKETQTLAVALAELEAEIANFDQYQRRAALVTMAGPQRIRGLAGSGKTVILAMKAARLHLNNPENRILVTFFTRSLRAPIKNFITRFFRHYKDEDPDWDFIHIRHGWGGANSGGTYADACRRAGVSPLTLQAAQRIGAANRTDPFDTACRYLLDNAHVEPFYDHVLIDEGQDFPGSFYEMCFHLTKGERDKKNIVWAYDDLQNILDVKIRTPQELFGMDDDSQPRISLPRAEQKNRVYTGVSNDTVLNCKSRSNNPSLKRPIGLAAPEQNCGS